MGPWHPFVLQKCIQGRMRVPLSLRVPHRVGHRTSQRWPIPGIAPARIEASACYLGVVSAEAAGVLLQVDQQVGGDPLLAGPSHVHLLVFASHALLRFHMFLP